MDEQDDMRTIIGHVRLLASVGVPIQVSTVGGRRMFAVGARDLHRVVESRVPYSLWLHSHTTGGGAVDTVIDDADAEHRIERRFTLLAAVKVAMTQAGRVGSLVREHFIEREASLRRVDRDCADTMARAALGGLVPPNGGPGLLDLLFGDGDRPTSCRSRKQCLH